MQLKKGDWVTEAIAETPLEVACMQHMQTVCLLLEIKRTIREELAALVEKHGLKAVAEAIGVSLSYVSDVVRDKRAVSVRLVGKIITTRMPGDERKPQ